MSETRQDPLETLRVIFSDKPELLQILTLRHLESEGLLAAYRQQADLFADPAIVWVTGRTSAGKTSIGNLLFGAKVMPSSGRINCTDHIATLLLKSNLCYIDTPGAGSKEKFENITRQALGLPLLDHLPVTEMKVRDYLPSNPDLYEEHKIPVEQWHARAAAYRPDAIVFVVAPQRGFVRDDVTFLRVLLAAHRDKVLICLNLFHKQGVELYTPENLEDARSEIANVYRDLFPNGEVKPRFVEMDAWSGVGINDLTGEVCRTVPSAKLGKVQTVLDGDLKELAARERDRRFRQALHRIAARLALFTVDQRFGDADLLGLAATGVAQYAAFTFEGVDTLAEIGGQIGALIDDQAAKARKDRTESVTTQEVQTRNRPIRAKIPRIETVESTRYIKDVVQHTVKASRSKGFVGVLGAYLDAGIQHLAAAAAGDFDARTHTAINDAARANSVEQYDQVVPKDREIPIKHLEQRVNGYEEQVVATVNEVVGVTEREVAQRALPGGVPVIELIVGVGQGVRRYVDDAPPGADAHAYIRTALDRVRLALDPYRSQLDQLVHQGGPAEEAIVDLIDDRLAAL